MPLLSIFNLSLMSAICFAAIWRGGRGLQLAAAALLVDGFGCEALQDLNGAHKAQPIILSIDLAYTVLLYAILVRTRTRWPIYAFVSNVLIVMTHLMANMDRGFTRWAFFSAYYVFSYALLVTLALAAAFEGR